MPCYILRAGDTDMVKIGWADLSVETRRKELQTAHWEDLVAIRVIEGDEWVERAMHRQFSDHRVKREWFRFTPEMLAFVPVPTPEVQPRPRKIYTPALQRVLEKFGPTALAKELGIKPWAIPQWRRVPVHHVDKVSSLTGIPRAELRPDVYTPEPQAAA